MHSFITRPLIIHSIITHPNNTNFHNTSTQNTPLILYLYNTSTQHPLLVPGRLCSAPVAPVSPPLRQDGRAATHALGESPLLREDVAEYIGTRGSCTGSSDRRSGPRLVTHHLSGAHVCFLIIHRAGTQSSCLRSTCGTSEGPHTSYFCIREVSGC